jgi:hypothetical protein
MIMNHEEHEKENQNEEKKSSHGGCCGGGHGHSHGHGGGKSSGLNVSRLILFSFLGIAGFFLITEHRAHLFGILPYLLILACPLMHLFHGRHGGHGGRHRDGESSQESKGNQKGVQS